MAERKRKALESKNSSKEITGVTAGFVLLFVIMMGYLGFYAATHQEELLNNSYNTRQQLFAAQNRRGTIYDSKGEILAQTQTRARQEWRRRRISICCSPVFLLRIR